LIALLQTRNNSRPHNEGGYALLTVIFMVATMILLASTAALRIDTQGRRERETELAWRGEQYERAIGLYFRKFGKYPTKVEDLVKQTNGVRFLRQAYTEPMNKDDGSWRFIYVGPGGQLIGSLRRTSLLQALITTPTLPGGPGASSSNPFGAPGQTNGQSPQPQPLEGAVIGGNIIGVASKVKQDSLRVYQGGDKYELWEFIWNPMQQVAIPGQGPIAPTGPTTSPGVPLPGGPPPEGTSPPTTPPANPQGQIPQ
jgi:hypothetical protein